MPPPDYPLDMLWELATRYEQSNGLALPDDGAWLDQDPDLMEAVLAVVARIRWARPAR